MNNLFISFDLGTNSSGNVVCQQELEALKSFGDEVIQIGHNDIDPVLYGLYRDPFIVDYLTIDILSMVNLDNINLAHIYGTTFTNTIRYLKAKGIKVTNTIAAHDRIESIKEFENLGLKYTFNHISDEKLWKIYSGSIREADIIITPSRMSAEFLRKEGAKDIRIISHGINILGNIKPINEKEFNIGFLGNWGPDKGLKYLIQSWSQLNYKDSTLIIAGPQTEQLGSFINRYASNGKFHLMGYIPDISDFYNGLSAYIQPSVSEGFGMEVIESASYGRPIICSDGAGASDFIEDGSNGFVVPKRDPKAISDKIQYFKRNPNEIIRMGKNARSKAIDYSWEKIRDKYCQIWSSLR
jgi:glycosyltransferase involved in cell wall biosynthesis